MTDENRATISRLQQSIKDEPGQVNLYVQLGYALFESEDLEAAQTAFQQALTLDPDIAAAHNGLGRVYERQKNSEAAIAAYETAIAGNTMGIAPYIGLGIVYFHQLDDFATAEQVFRAGLALQPDDPFALALLGIVYARTGRFDDAIDKLRQALNHDPDSVFALSNLSLIYLHLQRFQEMIATCQHELALHHDAEPHRLLGYAYDHLGQRQAAIAHLERAIALNPDDYEARGALASVYQSVGRHHDAEAQLAAGNALADNDNEYGRACFAAVRGDYDTAITLLEVGLAKGQVHHSWARIDPEFAFLQDDVRFQALLKRASSP